MAQYTAPKTFVHKPARFAARYELTESEMQEFKEVFDLIDRDKGGTLEAEEVKQLLDLLGMPASLLDVTHMIAEMDGDGSGAIDFDEFLQVMTRKQRLPYTRTDLLRAFRMFADPGAPSGCISPAALEKALLQYCSELLPADEVMRLVHRMELTPDGCWIRYRDQVDVLLST